MALIFLTVPLTLFIYVKWVGHSDPKLEALMVEAKNDGEATKTGFNKNYGRLVRTLIVVLVTVLLLVILGLLSSW